MSEFESGRPPGERRQAWLHAVSVWLWRLEVALPGIKAHLAKFTAPSDDSLVFVGPKNGQLRRPNFSATWRTAITAAELTGFHFHDLRHTGNHITAQSGATLRELMDRMGHSSTRAALLYQHRTAERDRLIASAMDEIIRLNSARPTMNRARSGHATPGLMLGRIVMKRDHAHELGRNAGAGDENRTRTISLGS